MNRYSPYESAWLGDVAGNPDVGRRSKKIQAIKYLFEKKTTPREKELDGFVFVCSEVMATEHSFSKINCFSILKKKNQMKVMQENILLSQPNESICAKAKESSWGVCS